MREPECCLFFEGLFFETLIQGKLKQNQKTKQRCLASLVGEDERA